MENKDFGVDLVVWLIFIVADTECENRQIKLKQTCAPRQIRDLPFPELPCGGMLWLYAYAGLPDSHLFL